APQCHWSPADEERMITFLCSRKDAAADGANFKLAVWNTLVAEMALHHGMGAPKTDKACKSKYSRLWTAYNTVTTLKGLSSFNWDDEKGMNIGIGEADAWKAYI
ncbi:hypothetical protein L208DRAFT_1135319, partial [Tricholoma matsutake]